MARSLEQVAGQIVQRWPGSETLSLVGVYRRGVPFSERLASLLIACGRNVELGRVDITQYRDDLQAMAMVPKLEGSDIAFDVDDAVVILCDEVIYTGRTSRAALEELLDHGRPRCVQFAVLVDRPGRELPIQPDFVGLKLHNDDLRADQRVSVRFEESDGWDEVFVRNVPQKAT